MKVKQLIELLKEMPEDYEVFSMCDHGQQPERSQEPMIACTPQDYYNSYSFETYMEPHEAQDEGYDEEDLVYFVLL